MNPDIESRESGRILAETSELVEQPSSAPAIEPHLSGLLPVAVFLVLFIGSGVVLKDFYAMPAIVAFVTALMVAFLQNRHTSFDDKLITVARSMGDETVMIMCLVFVLAGAFSGAVQAAGGVESTVNFALSILPPNIIVAGLFLIACFISLAMGTSVGTIAALAPIAAGIAQQTGFGGGLCLAAIVGGAMFGDNLSMISDTTIAATRTQDCKMDEKFKENFKLALPAAIITFLLFLALGNGATYTPDGALEYSLWEVLPYLVVLFAALAGMNVFLVLALGTVLSIIVGVMMGTISPADIFVVIGSGPDGKGGIMNMYDITVISIVCAGIIGLVKMNGGLEWLLKHVHALVKGPRGAQLGIAALGSLVDVSTANNTVAIVMSGPIVKDISQQYGVTPRRAASVLDIFTSVWQGIIPYGAQILYASAGAAALGLVVTPFDIMPYLLYPYVLGLVTLVFIMIWGAHGQGHEARKAAVDKAAAEAKASAE